jgi:hypothetical protein
MKHFILLAFLVSVTIAGNSQGSLPKGKAQLNFGVGFSGWGVPVYLGFDHGISRDFTLGAEISHRSYKENWKDNTYKHAITGISGNINYHFNNAINAPKEVDLYGGLNLGFFVWSSPDAYDGTHNSGLGLGAQIGGRYYLSNKVGLNLELGGGSAFSGGKFGLTVKL